MKNKLKFINKFYYLFNKLPLTFISMEKWDIIQISGIDRIKYIQKKVTCDLFFLKKNNFILGSYCNEKGKTISFFYIFNYQKKIFILVESSIIKLLIKEFKKYSIFSKILFKKNYQYLLFGVVGVNSKKIINKIFDIKIKKQTLFFKKKSIILYFNKPNVRFLIITNNQTYLNILNNFKKKFKFNDSNQWLLLDIQSGYPIIDLNNVNKFIPHFLNIDKLKGISYKKGCYLGQEIIHTFKYNKKINKHLFCFKCILLNQPLSGDLIEIKNKNNWLKLGIVLTSCLTINNVIIIQSIIKKNISFISTFKIKNNYFKFINL
ncbi:MAG: tRNA-modifying protein YgfZ [Candidatus Makana argininalis]